MSVTCAFKDTVTGRQLSFCSWRHTSHHASSAMTLLENHSSYKKHISPCMTHVLLGESCPSHVLPIFILHWALKKNFLKHLKIYTYAIGIFIFAVNLQIFKKEQDHVKLIINCTCKWWNVTAKSPSVMAVKLVTQSINICSQNINKRNINCFACENIT